MRGDCFITDFLLIPVDISLEWSAYSSMVLPPPIFILLCFGAFRFLGVSNPSTVTVFVVKVFEKSSSIRLYLGASTSLGFVFLIPLERGTTATFFGLLLNEFSFTGDLVYLYFVRADVFLVGLAECFLGEIFSKTYFRGEGTAFTVGELTGDTSPKGSFFCFVLIGVSSPALALKVLFDLLTEEALNVFVFFLDGVLFVFFGAFFLMGFFATFFTIGSSF